MGVADPLHLMILLGALILALGFEFVNGFHDTANAVATVIYTKSLPPWAAVIWSGIWNFLGVLNSGGAVAFGVLSLLPSDLITHVISATGFAMIFSLLFSALLWNLGTWYLGLPASSSHSLIGSILGVGLMNSYLHTGSFAGGLNWSKAEDVGMALLVSPLVGFVGTAALMAIFRIFGRNTALNQPMEPGKSPPWWVRASLCLTCTGVSYAHGSNDGQKGMGLLMLVLVAMVPGLYAVDLSTSPASLSQITVLSQSASQVFSRQLQAAPTNSIQAGAVLEQYLRPRASCTPSLIGALTFENNEILLTIKDQKSLVGLAAQQRDDLRSSIYLVSETLGKLARDPSLDPSEASILLQYRSALKQVIQFIPIWVKTAVALAMGLGTMVGWKRIVVTVGEKIGKAHLTCAQGASAEFVTMATIGLADRYGLPVSTTHVLSSGVAGAMAANRSGLQMKTLRNLLLAWVLTLPVCVFMGALLFAATLLVLAHSSGLNPSH